MRASEGGNKRLPLVAGHLTLVNTWDSEYGIGLKSVYLSRVDERGVKGGGVVTSPSCECWGVRLQPQVYENVFRPAEEVQRQIARLEP